MKRFIEKILLLLLSAVAYAPLLYMLIAGTHKATNNISPVVLVIGALAVYIAVKLFTNILCKATTMISQPDEIATEKIGLKITFLVLLVLVIMAMYGLAVWLAKTAYQTMDIYFVIVYAMLVIQDVHEFLGKDFRIYNAGTK